MHAGIDDDEPETFPCYRHADRETALRCVECDRAICVECAVQAPVGFKCPDDARTSRAARGVVPAHRLARGVVAAVVVALVLGVALTIVNVPFLGLILAYFAGAGTGEVARRASGGYRDPALARAAALAAVAGFIVLPLLWVVGGASPAALAWPLLFAIAAAFGAYSRAA